MTSLKLLLFLVEIGVRVRALRLTIWLIRASCVAAVLS